MWNVLSQRRTKRQNSCLSHEFVLWINYWCKNEKNMRNRDQHFSIPLPQVSTQYRSRNVRARLKIISCREHRAHAEPRTWHKCTRKDLQRDYCIEVVTFIDTMEQKPHGLPYEIAERNNEKSFLLFFPGKLLWSSRSSTFAAWDFPSKASESLVTD